MLKVSNLTVEYEGVTALRGISESFATGRLCAVFGPNGAGKTTLLKAIAGLIDITRGNIFYKGEEITSLSPVKRVKMGIQYIPDRARVGMKMTVEENLRIGGFLRKKDEVTRALDEIFTLFPELAEQRNAPAGILSGGQRQMLVIGRACVSSPRIMLFDEPFFGLSRKTRNVIAELLRGLKKRGITLIIAEHDVEEILPISDSYLVFLGGEVVSRGEGDTHVPIEELKKTFRKIYQSGRSCGEEKKGK